MSLLIYLMRLVCNFTGECDLNADREWSHLIDLIFLKGEIVVHRATTCTG